MHSNKACVLYSVYYILYLLYNTYINIHITFQASDGDKQYSSSYTFFLIALKTPTQPCPFIWPSACRTHNIYRLFIFHFFHIEANASVLQKPLPEAKSFFILMASPPL